jgi:hypothetical protein
MSEFDIKTYLKQLEKTLEVKELESFYVMCDRADFKPMKGYHRPKMLTDMFAEKIQYYAGKRVAHISLYTNPKGLKTNEYVFSIKIVIYNILDTGKLDQKRVLGLMVNYEPDDFERRRFHIKDVEKFMRLCADKTLTTGTLNGQWYKKVIRMLQKKGVDFEADD